MTEKNECYTNATEYVIYTIPEKSADEPIYLTSQWIEHEEDLRAKIEFNAYGDHNDTIGLVEDKI